MISIRGKTQSHISRERQKKGYTRDSNTSSKIKTMNRVKKTVSLLKPWKKIYEKRVHSMVHLSFIRCFHLNNCGLRCYRNKIAKGGNEKKINALFAKV